MSEQQKQWGDRERLPPDREGLTHHFAIATGRPAPEDWLDVYVSVGLKTIDVYDDSEPPPGMAGPLPVGKETVVREIFVKVGKSGSELAMVDQWAVALSVALQCGAEPRALFGKFVGQRFEPSGRTRGCEEIKQCSSIVDYVARWVLLRFYPEPSAVTGEA